MEDGNGIQRKNQKRKKRNSGKTVEAENVEIQEKVSDVDASFIEGRQLIEMSIRAEDEHEFPDEISQTAEHSDSDEDQLQSSEDDNVNIMSDGEIMEEDRENELDDRGVDLPTQKTATISRKQMKLQKLKDVDKEPTTQQRDKIKAIDDEMLKRITDLHAIMTEGGLQESAAMLEKCAETVHRGQPTRQVRLTGEECQNSNANAVMYKHKRLGEQYDNVIGKRASIQGGATVGLLKRVNSEVTIYEHAVPKRNSSSSEEDYNLNSSDELEGLD